MTIIKTGFKPNDEPFDTTFVTNCVCFICYFSANMSFAINREYDSFAF